MTQFVVSIAVFLALHSVPAIPAFRQRLVAMLGRRVYLALYSLASLLTLGWVFHSALRLDYVELWPPAAWQAWFPLILSPVAFFLLLSGLLSPNPVSVSLRKSDGQTGAVVSITRHPVLWGFLFWAFGHAIANGDLRSLILFGVFVLFSIFGILVSERRNQLNPLLKSTSVMPFAAIISGRTRLGFDLPMLIAMLFAALLTAWLLSSGHAVLLGADPLAMALN